MGHGSQPVVAPSYMMPGSTYVDNSRCLEFADHVVQHLVIPHNVPQQCFASGSYQQGEYTGSTMNGFEVADGQMRMVRNAMHISFENCLQITNCTSKQQKQSTNLCVL